MHITDQLAKYITDKNLVNSGDKILLAVSGGKDSMLMAALFKDLGYDCILAHCNFKLRAKESDLDEALVREYAEELGFPIHVQYFDTKQYATKHKLSIQMAARELRYTWFEDLRQKLDCSVIAIAQHQNDHLETVLLNLTRSTGLLGLTGIQPKRGTIIRPLLFITAEELGAEVERLHIPYRDDQSNFSTKYARNKIRLELIPKFEEIQPDFQSILSQNIQHFQESYNFINAYISDLRNKLFIPQGGYLLIEQSALAEHTHNPYLLFELFKPFGFQKSVIKDMIASFSKEMGQLFESPSYELLMNRKQLILREKQDYVSIYQEIPHLEEPIRVGDNELSFNHKYTLDKIRDKHSVQIDFQKLKFPLILRNWEHGDWFKPLGMNGSKKISDFFIQQKVNRFQKQNVPILVNGNGEVIWIIGFRLDNRFKVVENTKKVVTLVFK